MPVLIWDSDNEEASSYVETDWPFKWTPEEFREEAEALDRELDAMLDGSLQRVEKLGHSKIPAPFVRAWSIGRALTDSAIFQADALQNESAERLWKALAAKCRTGRRSSGERQPRWTELRPSGDKRPRREGRKLDYFDMCVWLADQEFEDAADTFGGHIRNVWQMLERRSLNPPIVRDALLRWLIDLAPAHRESLTRPKAFPEMMKKLRGRWPDRGPGSAKRPTHYTEDDLLEEIRKVLAPLESSALDVSAGAGG